MIKSSLKSKNGPSVYEPFNLILSREIGVKPYSDIFL